MRFVDPFIQRAGQLTDQEAFAQEACILDHRARFKAHVQLQRR